MTAKDKIKEKILTFAKNGDIESLAYYAGQLEVLANNGGSLKVTAEEAKELMEEVDYRISEFYAYDAIGDDWQG